MLPDGVDLRLGALVEPMAVGRHAVSRSGVEPGGTALVAGAGPIGIGSWSALKARGVDKVLVSERSADRRAVTAALSARVVDPANEDLAAAIASLTDGDGVDVAVDAAGAVPAITSTAAEENSALLPGGRSRTRRRTGGRGHPAAAVRGRHPSRVGTIRGTRARGDRARLRRVSTAATVLTRS
ncbi:zinc-binding dehydrogenase [Streptomyces sp. NPDC079020]|uniref:zinc-binding dehydrogenase n=1 Tax=Streptomyces sp. NPDC079020 TaxID=3365722 RepID=UPI0037D2A1DA